MQAALITWAYTVAITVVAARETEKTPPKYLIHLPTAFLGMVAISILRAPASPNRLPAIMLVLWGMTEASIGAWSVAKGNIPVPALIGRLIRIMITLQAAWIMLAVSMDRGLTTWCLGLFLLLKFSAAWASRKFYGS